MLHIPVDLGPDRKKGGHCILSHSGESDSSPMSDARQYRNNSEGGRIDENYAADALVQIYDLNITTDDQAAG